MVNKSSLQSKPPLRFTVTRDNIRNIKNTWVNNLPRIVQELRFELQHGVYPKFEFPYVSLKIRSVSLMGVKSRWSASREVANRVTNDLTHVFSANTCVSNCYLFTEPYNKVTANEAKVGFHTFFVPKQSHPHACALHRQQVRAICDARLLWNLTARWQVCHLAYYKLLRLGNSKVVPVLNYGTRH
jgi:hypothetical protein